MTKYQSIKAREWGCGQSTQLCNDYLTLEEGKAARRWTAPSPKRDKWGFITEPLQDDHLLQFKKNTITRWVTLQQSPLFGDDQINKNGCSRRCVKDQQVGMYTKPKTNMEQPLKCQWSVKMSIKMSAKCPVYCTLCWQPQKPQTIVFPLTVER